jgi:hypothetical protein
MVGFFRSQFRPALPGASHRGEKSGLGPRIARISQRLRCAPHGPPGSITVEDVKKVKGKRNANGCKTV